MIECYNLTKKYDSKVVALDNISVKIETGEFIAVIGESGSGKSTFLNLIGLIDRKDSGEIIVDNESYDNLTEQEAANFRNLKLGYIFQDFYLESEYSVYKNLEIPMLIAGYSKKERKKVILNVINKVGMQDKINQITKNLSGGEKQRVCIARALTNNPDIILADEPCGNLDSRNTQIILEILKKMNDEGKTIVMVTHSQEDSMIADRCILFRDGKIIDDKKN